MRQCKECKRIKAVSEFYKYKSRKKRKGKYYLRCKDCHKVYFKRFWEKRKKKFGGLYGIWRHIKGRCNNPNDKVYRYYGGRGIKICEEWQNNFIYFYNWAIKNGFKKGLTIDRKGNDGHYSPENCRFVTQEINNHNRSYVKLNPSEVRKIRTLCKEGNLKPRYIGQLFGVGESTVSNIRRGKVWKNV